MKRKMIVLLFVIMLLQVLMIPGFASAEEEKSVIDLKIGKTAEGVLKDGKVKSYRLEPTSNGLLTVTIKCFAKDELHTSIYPEGKSDPYPKITRYDEKQGYSLLQYELYVSAGIYQLDLSNPIIVISGSYRIHTEFTPIYTIDYERNNSLKQATPISNHKSYPGVLTYGETEDYYTIKFTKSKQFQMKVTCNEKTSLNITVKNSKGAIVAEGRAYHNTTIFLLDQKLAAGTYTIIISHKEKDGLYGLGYRIVTGDYIPIKEVDLPTSKTMKLGDIYTFKPSLKPSDATGACYYTSSDPKIVKITMDGRATAIKKGKVTITARAYDGKAKDTCVITVGDLSVKKLSLSKTKLSLTVGDSYTLKAEASPQNATKGKPTWKSSNEKIATVSSTGKVTAKGTGTCTITAKLEGKSATATITVSKKPEPTPKPKPTATPTPTPTPANVTVESISMDKNLQLKVGETKELIITFTPEHVTNKTLIWTCTNESVAMLKDGKVTGMKAGIATVVVTSFNGKRTFCKIEVSE